MARSSRVGRIAPLIYSKPPKAVFGVTHDFLHKSQVAQVPFPSGVPIGSGSAGLFVNRPSRLPVMLLFRDWDILWIRSGRARFQIGSQIGSAAAATLVAGADDFVILPICTPIHVSCERDPLSWQFCHFAFRPAPELSPHDARRDDYAGPGAGALLPLCFSAAQAPGVKRAYASLARWHVSKSTQFRQRFRITPLKYRNGTAVQS